MTQPLHLAESRLLLPAGLDAGGLDRAFGTLLGPGVDFGDLYFQHTRSESWTVEDGTVKNGAHSIEQGVGVRAISGEKTGFSYSDEINGEALQLAARSARAIARDGSSVTTRALVRSAAARPVPSRGPDRLAPQRGEGRGAAPHRPLRARRRPARDAGGGQPVGRPGHGAGRAQRRRAGRRRAPAGALQRAGDRRAERPPRKRLLRRRWPLRLRRAAGRRQARGLRARGPAPGAGQPRRRRRSRRHHAGGAGQRLARRAAARGGRPWPGRRLQPQGHLDLRRPHGPAGGGTGRHHRRRRHAAGPARLAQRRRRRQRRPSAPR